MKNGNAWSLFSNETLNINESLPPGNYTVRFNELAGQYFLEETEPFDIPKKIYGKAAKHCQRIIESFNNRDDGCQVGVLLEGTKGSGKTLLAKLVSKMSNLPTIIVNTSFTGEKFMRSIQEIDQPAVVIFDEFEKLYNNEKQEQILTMFDGVYSLRNKIIIVTCNDKFAIREFFHNRPGRLRYSIHYDGLDELFIKDYCDDNLKNMSYLPKIVNLSNQCPEFNFDMLQCLVSELNMFNDTFEDVIDILNVKPFNINQDAWDVEMIVPDGVNDEYELSTKTIRIDPIETMTRYHSSIEIDLLIKPYNYESEDDFDYQTLYLTTRDILTMSKSKGEIFFEQELDGVNLKVVLRKEKKLARYDF
jgi:hypothetical protein